MAEPGPFTTFMTNSRAAGELVVQPRMGFSDPDAMRRGLRAVRDVDARTIGTITLDSYTRTGQHVRAREALARGQHLNGYPIVALGADTTRDLVAEFDPAEFPIQVRHGSPRPRRIFEELIDAGLSATEGGPVSYCLPYGRVPLVEAIDEWARCCELLASRAAAEPHLESFGGCMLGQLCPPGLLVALSILEGIFFAQHGLRSISLSYAQQTSFEQDVSAITALRRLADTFLPYVTWHVVVYTYMGVYPRSADGARELLEQSARLAVTTGSERLIVKTAAEAFRIPSIQENATALRQAGSTARSTDAAPVTVADDDEVYREAEMLVETVLELRPAIGEALVAAFQRGLLDVPFCLHPDNANVARAAIDGDSRLRWTDTGRMPISGSSNRKRRRIRATELLDMLTYNQRRFDGERPAETACRRGGDRRW